jgi:hypothetical protein
MFALEAIGGTLALKGAPGSTAKPAQIFAYFTGQTSHIVIGTWLLLLAGVFWFIYLGCLYSAVKAKEDGVGRLSVTLLATGSAAAALGVAADAFTAAAADRAAHGTLTPGMATVYFDAANSLTYSGMAVTLAAFSLAFGVAAYRYDTVLPRWLGAVSILLAVLYLVPPVSWVGVDLGLLITLYVSVLLYRDKAGVL